MEFRGESVDGGGKNLRVLEFIKPKHIIMDAKAFPFERIMIFLELARPSVNLTPVTLTVGIVSVGI